MCNGEAVAYATFVRAHPKLRFVGVNVEDTVAGARAYVKRYRWSWPSLRDPDRDLEARLGVLFQPVVVVIDPRGRIAGIHVGRGSAADWEQLLRSAMG